MARWLRKDKSGFTMIELMVVVIIVAVLAAVAVPLYTSYIKNSRKSEATARLGAILTAAKSYYQENNGWPTSATASGFYGDFTGSDHFTYAQTSSASTGRYTARATGNGTDGISTSMTVSMSSAVDSAAAFTYAGF
jgi:type IV pilus assembly protein PilE